MALKKMQILGIRSFGPDENDAATIIFNTPLTLILGQNGCGKTTIIEALKYATCGEVPSNASQGSAFVHDPKITNRLEVRGQVKLVCSTAKGDNICISRSVSVTQKLKKLMFKTLDSTITWMKSGTDEKESISGRCLDVDMEMCLALGVTKPILHYVIFCHQEDSCWPLDENKKLKEKFDQIFDATKYNRCLEQMRKDRKKALEALKVAENNLGYLKKFEEEARKKQQILNETVEKLVQCNQDMIEMDQQLVPLDERYKQIKAKEANCTALHTSREKLKAKLEEFQKSKRELEGTIGKVFEGSDEQLNEAIRTFDDDFSEKKNQLKNLEREKETLNEDVSDIQDKIERKKIQQGQLNEAEKIYQRKIVTRNKEITILAKKLELQAPNTSQMSGTGADAREVLHEIDTKLEVNTELLEVIRVTNLDAEKQIQEKIDACRVKKAKFEQDISFKEDQLKEADADYKKVTEDIHDADQSVNTLIILENKLSRVNRELDEANQTTNLEDLEKSIQEQKAEKYRLEDELKSIGKELEDLRVLRDDQKALDAKRNQKLEQEGKIRKLKNKHGDTLKHLLGQIPEQGIKSAFSDRLEALDRDIKSKTRAMNSTNEKLINMKANRKNKAEKLRDMQNELRVKENEIYELCENKDFDTVLNEVCEDVKKKQDMKGTWFGTEYLLGNYMQKLSDPNACCPLCHRDFDSREEADELVQELKNNVARIPQQSMEVARKLDTLLDKQSRLFQLKPTNDKVMSLKNIEIPALKSELEDIEKEIEKLQKDFNSTQNDLVQPEEDESMGNRIRSDIISLDQLTVDLRNLEREITDLEAKLGSRNKGASFDQVLEEYKKKEEDKETVSKNLDSNQTKLQVQSKRLNELTNNRNGLIQQQLELKIKSQKRADLVEKRSDLETLKACLRAELDDMNEQLQPLSSELESLQKELKRTCSQHLSAFQEKQRHLQSNKNKFLDIQTLQKDIEDYEKGGGSALVNAVEEELKALQKQKEDVAKQLNVLMEKIKEIEQFASNLKASRQNLVSNKTLRDKIYEGKEYEKRINELGIELGNLNPEKLKTELNKILLEEEKIKRKKGQAQGRAEELENSIKAYENELNGDNYKNADTNYKNQLIELKVRELAAKDLGTYMLALDWAMIHFHKERMKNINTIIRNLWRQIYSGNDIDTIEIKTEESDSTSIDRRRTYNYRVVCKRGNTEMDMRGRCSAGQKILTCLIIRMALAETFSKNCGVLALDEPTANLDQENIDSLCTALGDIIATRCKQKNFQLLVITHDEDFLMRLSQIEKVPFYLKVQRNRQGKSEVLKIIIDGE